MRANCAVRMVRGQRNNKKKIIKIKQAIFLFALRANRKRERERARSGRKPYQFFKL